MYNYLVFIGRFQPFHAGHFHVVKEALKQSSEVIIVLGSHDSPRTSKNPFTTQERMEIIKTCFTHAELDRIHFAAQYDHPYNEEKWIAGVQASVNTIMLKKFNPDPVKIGIIGYDKDHSSYYLKKFPAWENVYIEPAKSYDGYILNATEVRYDLFGLGALYPGQIFLNNEHKINGNHADKCYKFVREQWDLVRNELDHITKYKEQWEVAPYKPTFVTVDAVVTQSGHVLVVERGAQPGEGLWALPGGFLNQNETVKEASIRELYEETKIDVPKPVLLGSIVSSSVFDFPDRSLRGRTITHAFHFKLSDRPDLPRIKGSDDAKKAFWITFDEFAKSRNRFFEDHFSIIESMVGL